MRAELEEIRIIEAYLEGNMSASDREKTEAKMATEPEFKKKVEVQRDLTEGVFNAALIAEIEQVHTDFIKGEGGAGSGGGLKPWMWILGIALIIGIGLSLFLALPGDQKPASREEGKAIISESPSEGILPESKGEKEEAQAPEPFRLPGGFRVPFEQVRFDAEQGLEFEYGRSGTRINIPGGILTDAKGNPVTGEVEFRYREFRDAAEMAFTEIPMHWRGEKDAITRFNSAGMFEMRAYQNGRQLSIDSSKGQAKVDFVATGQLEDLKFWELNEPKGTWRELRDINFPQREIGEVTDIMDGSPVWAKGEIQENFQALDTIRGFEKPRNKGPSLPEFLAAEALNDFLNEAFSDLGENGKVEAQVDLGPYGNPMELRVISGASPEFDEIALEGLRYFGGWTGLFFQGKPLPSKVRMDVEYSKRKGLSVDMNKDVNEFLERNADVINREEWPNDRLLKWNESFLTTVDSLRRSALRKEQSKNDPFRTQLIEGSDPGHTYPTMVKGLLVDGFGVYNCDQIYVLETPFYVKPKLTNAGGDALNNMYVLSVIDLEFNAAFSFDPQRGFQINRQSPTFVLLFTKDGRLFGAKPKMVRELQKVSLEKQQLNMVELTSKVNSTEGLRKYLGLESPS